MSYPILFLISENIRKMWAITKIIALRNNDNNMACARVICWNSVTEYGRLKCKSHHPLFLCILILRLYSFIGTYYLIPIHNSFTFYTRKIIAYYFDTASQDVGVYVLVGIIVLFLKWTIQFIHNVHLWDHSWFISVNISNVQS